MENITKNNFTISIISILIASCSLLFGIYKLLSDQENLNSGGIIVIILSSLCICIAAFLAFWQYNRFKQSRILLLDNKDKIIKAIGKYSKDGKYDNATFIGELDDNIINIIISNFDSKHIKSVNLISTDGYSNVDSTVKQLFEMEAKFDDSEFSSKLITDYQLCNVFIAQNNSQKAIIIFFRNDHNDYSGLEIRENRFSINTTKLLLEPFSMNIETKQSIAILEVLGNIKKLWLPCKYGYFQSVLPPLNNMNVRQAWREKILQEFNIYASEIVTSFDCSEIFITWNITILSENDISTFKDWLLLLHGQTQKTQLRVNRYILINISLLKTDVSYRNVVNTIVVFLNSHINNNYKIYFVDSSQMQPEHKNDYTLIRFSNHSGDHFIIQSAIIDNDAEPMILKIYFSKGHKEVRDVRNRFQTIERLMVENSFENFKSRYSIV